MAPISPLVIPLGDIDGNGANDFIAAVREDVTVPVTTARLVLGSTTLSDVTLDSSGPTLRIPAQVLAAAQEPGVSGSRRAFFAAPATTTAIISTISRSRSPTRLAEATRRKAVYLIFGKSGPWTGELDVVKDADAAIPMQGTFSIANAGDVDHDGKDDLLIGKTAGDPRNRAYLFYGGTTGRRRDLYLADFSGTGATGSLDGVHHR